jgi:hypothetical protein
MDFWVSGDAVWSHGGTAEQTRRGLRIWNTLQSLTTQRALLPSSGGAECEGEQARPLEAKAQAKGTPSQRGDPAAPP